MKEKRDYQKILIWAKKIKAVQLLGGKCEKCGNSNIFHLTFHHNNPEEKTFEFNDLREKRWSIIEKEIKKCSLLCQNCHNELHFSEEKNKRKSRNKKLFLDLRHSEGCEKCGYNENNSALHFHHEGDKNYGFSSFVIEFKNLSQISGEILSELENCKILCANCHTEHHTDVEFFNLNKDEIYDKSRNIRENSSKINREIVRKMYFDDKLKQIQISNYFGCSKGTICDIIKELKNTYSN